MSAQIKSSHIQGNVFTIDLDDSYRPNDVWGTFGFHTANTLPERCRTLQFARPAYNNLDDSAFLARVQNNPSTMNSCDAATINIFNCLGYFPVLGLVPCAVLLFVPLADSNSSMHNEPTAVKIAHYIRGGAAGLGIGSIYLIPDICVTLHRFLKA